LTQRSTTDRLGQRVGRRSAIDGTVLAYGYSSFPNAFAIGFPSVAAYLGEEMTR
jgi:hypothetical protein